MARSRIPNDSPFDALDVSFHRLCVGSPPLSIEGGLIPGLPDRFVPLDELKSILLHPSTSYATRDAAIACLLDRADEENWLVGLAGVLLPGIRRAAWPLWQASSDKADIEAEVLAGLVAAVRGHPRGKRLAARLTWAARRAGERLVQAETAQRGRPGGLPVSEEPPRPYGHPDFVLLEAVDKGIICRDDAVLIATNRLEGIDLQVVAHALGISYRAARDRRLSAERALIQGIRDGFPANRPQNPDSSVGGRPRTGQPTKRRPEKRRSDQSIRR